MQTSLTWIKELGLAADAPIIDVGAGAPTLADDLLDAGYRSITVLDISESALTSISESLGTKKVEQLTWLNGDITAIDLPSHYYELWHDRAAFHFLTEHNQQGSRQSFANRFIARSAILIRTIRQRQRDRQ